jgi:hypothetical protein
MVSWGENAILEELKEINEKLDLLVAAVKAPPIVGTVISNFIQTDAEPTRGKIAGVADRPYSGSDFHPDTKS